MTTDTRSSADSWLHEALERLLRETLSFCRTFGAFVLRPGRSAHAWHDGRRRFMNPLGFAATSASAYWGVASVLSWVWPIPGPDASNSLLRDLSSAVGPYVHYGLLGIAMHLVLRVLGSHRRAFGSLGVALFVGGSIGTILAVLMSATARYLGHLRGTSALELGTGDPAPLALLIAAAMSYGLVCLAMARGLTGLHGAPIWKAATAAGSAVLITAVLFGSVLPDGDYGWRPYIAIDVGESTFAFGFRG